MSALSQNKYWANTNYTTSSYDNHYDVTTSGTASFLLQDWVLATKNVTTNMRAWSANTTKFAKSLQSLTVPLGRTAPPLNFNPYISASDLLKEFIQYAADQGVRKNEVLQLPVELFLKWLIIRACEEDQEEPEVTLQLPQGPQQPRCLGCQKWMKRGTTMPLHSPRCSDHYFKRQNRELVSASVVSG